MSASDEDSTKVYCTAPDVTEQAVYECLRNDVNGSVDEVKENFKVLLKPGERPVQIFKHQQGNYKVPDYDEQDYFLIVDEADAARDGVLLCTLEADHGFPDAVRAMPDAAGMAAASLSIANTNWSEEREDAFLDPKPPRPRLAVYDNRQHGDRASFHPLADAVDIGVHYLNDDEGTRTMPSIDDLFRYLAISLQGSHSTEELYKQHQRCVDEKGVDGQRFAVVDDKFAQEGAWLVQVEPRKQLRCKPPVAGELLWWNQIGFMSWDEVEAFAAKHSDYKRKPPTKDTSAADAAADPAPKRDESEAGDQGQTQDIVGEPPRRFRYYRTKLGMVIASMEPNEVPSTFKRPRQESDGLDENGERSAIEDTIVEELPWDYYLKKDSAGESQ